LLSRLRARTRGNETAAGTQGTPTPIVTTMVMGPVAGVATAIIGIGDIGGALARHLVRGGEPVVLAAKDEANAAALAQELGELARAAAVEEAIVGADAVVFAVWLDTIKELTAKDADLLEGKVVVDPSNPIGIDENGEMTRTLPDDQSAGSVVAAMLPTGEHYVKAFGTLGADLLASAANREPRRAVLLYAADDDATAAAIERLIRHDYPGTRRSGSQQTGRSMRWRMTKLEATTVRDNSAELRY
jgi:8-hydroxy-5-deazaflavin:NADPH oxidoreductase